MRKVALRGLVTLAVAVLGITTARLLEGSSVGEADFYVYWAAGRLFLEGRNPCDAENMLAVERKVYDPDQRSVMMAWNPPSLWVLILPLAWMPFGAARSVWLLTNVSLLLACCVMLRSIALAGRSAGSFLVYCLTAAVFPPVLLTIFAGQITLLVLFGVVASLYLIRREHWFWAGAALVLTSVKPHLVLLVGPYLLLYMAKRRKWAGWIGLGAAGAVCVLILCARRAAWLEDYLSVVDIFSVDWATPTIGGLLGFYGCGRWARLFSVVGFLLLPLLLRGERPVALETAVSVLILVTLPTTFFGWSFDHSLLLVPVAQIIGWLSGPLLARAEKCTVGGAMAAAVVTDIAQRIAQTSEVFYLWVPLAWGGIYGMAWWMVRRGEAREHRDQLEGARVEAAR